MFEPTYDRCPAAEPPLRVLVVDDNADAADSLAAVVELLGCDTRVCYSGLAAVEAVRAEVPDVVLLDLSMPGLDGLETAARVRALAGDRPLLLVATTALGAWEERTATALAGFHFHLVKPVPLAELTAALDRFRAVRAAARRSAALRAAPRIPTDSPLTHAPAAFPNEAR